MYEVEREFLDDMSSKLRYPDDAFQVMLTSREWARLCTLCNLVSPTPKTGSLCWVDANALRDFIRLANDHVEQSIAATVARKLESSL